MRTYLMTRGLGCDYGFLGSPPAQPWWREFGQFTAFERPTLLIHADATEWQVYASAIPTTRRDRTNTLIRLSLVLTGQHQRPPANTPTPAEAAAANEYPVSAELSGVLALITSWLAGPTASASDRLVALLAEQFPADDTERLISTAGQANDTEVARRVQRVLAQLGNDASRPHHSAIAASAQPGSWLGDVATPEARAAFLNRVQVLLLGDDCGWAVQLNLAGAAEIRAYFERQHEPLAVLLDERVAGGLSGLAPKAVTPARARAPAASRTRVPRTRVPRTRVPRTRVIVAIAALLLMGLIGLILWLLAHSSPTPMPTPTPAQSQQLTVLSPSTSRSP